MNELINIFYTQVDGKFAVVAIRKADRAHINVLCRLLEKLQIHDDENLVELRRVWKSIDRTSTREYMSNGTLVNENKI